jgi:purine nucleoside permease
VQTAFPSTPFSATENGTVGNGETNRTGAAHERRRTAFRQGASSVRFALALIGAILWSVGSAAAEPPLVPRVLVVVAFQDNGTSPPTMEAAPWVRREGLSDPIVTASHVSLRCNVPRTICLLVSGVGKTNALASLLSLGLDPGVDLRRTYVVVSGIAGVSPEQATIGTPAWASYVVDYDLAHEIDARQLPASFPDSRFEQGCMTTPWCGKAGWRAGTEMYRLDPKAVRFAYAITRHVALSDPPLLANVRARYAQPAARARPHVTRCDIVAGDTYWVGSRLGRFSDAWMKHWTAGRGTYCMTANEDVAFAVAMKKLTQMGRGDYARFVDLRTGSDFDREHPGQTAIEALRAGIADGTFEVAAENGYRTARVFVRYVNEHWDSLRNGLP